MICHYLKSWSNHFHRVARRVPLESLRSNGSNCGFEFLWCSDQWTQVSFLNTSDLNLEKNSGFVLQKSKTLERDMVSTWLEQNQPLVLDEAPYQPVGTKIKHHVYFNETLTKGRLKKLVGWCCNINGGPIATQMVETLKRVGYDFSTRAGISIGVDDLLVPRVKRIRVSHARMQLNRAYHELDQGHLSRLEYFDNLLSTWNRVNLRIKDEVLRTFRQTDPLNPVYMMAFSGARGNISQVRQLTGMRGLMSDQMGQVVSFAIQSNFREGMTLTEYMLSCHGARKGVVDTALRTATSGYLTRRLVDVVQHIIVCQYDCQTYHGIKINAKYLGSNKAHHYIGRVLARGVQIQGQLLGRRNQEIDAKAAHYLMSQPVDWFIRSPLTCMSLKGICRLCYGWGFSSYRLVALGECVGVLAGQSIGEPGTQLTMRTFHTGGVFSTTEVFENLTSPYSGRVFFPKALPGQCVRVRYGYVGYLVKQPFSIHIGPHLLQLPSFTVIFMKQGQYIYKDQIIGEFAAELTTKQRTLQMINASITGQVYFDNLFKYHYQYTDITKASYNLPNDPARRIHYWVNSKSKWHIPVPIPRGLRMRASRELLFSHWMQQKIASAYPQWQNDLLAFGYKTQTGVLEKESQAYYWHSLLSDPRLIFDASHDSYHRSRADTLDNGALIQNTRVWLLSMEKQCLNQTPQIVQPTDHIDAQTALTYGLNPVDPRPLLLTRQGYSEERTSKEVRVPLLPEGVPNVLETPRTDLSTQINRAKSVLGLSPFGFQFMALHGRVCVTLHHLHYYTTTQIQNTPWKPNQFRLFRQKSYRCLTCWLPEVDHSIPSSKTADFAMPHGSVKTRRMLMTPNYVYVNQKATSCGTSCLFTTNPGIKANKIQRSYAYGMSFQYGLSRRKFLRPMQPWPKKTYATPWWYLGRRLKRPRSTDPYHPDRTPRLYFDQGPWYNKPPKPVHLFYRKSATNKKMYNDEGEEIGKQKVYKRSYRKIMVKDKLDIVLEIERLREERKKLLFVEHMKLPTHIKQIKIALYPVVSWDRFVGIFTPKPIPVRLDQHNQALPQLDHPNYDLKSECKQHWAYQKEPGFKVNLSSRWGVWGFEVGMSGIPWDPKKIRIWQPNMTVLSLPPVSFSKTLDAYGSLDQGPMPVRTRLDPGMLIWLPLGNPLLDASTQTFYLNFETKLDSKLVLQEPLIEHGLQDPIPDSKGLRQQSSPYILTRFGGTLTQNVRSVTVKQPILKTYGHEQKKFFFKYLLQPNVPLSYVTSEKMDIEKHALTFGYQVSSPRYFELHFKNQISHKPEQLKKSMTWTWKKSKRWILPINPWPCQSASGYNFWAMHAVPEQVRFHWVHAMQWYISFFFGYIMILGRMDAFYVHAMVWPTLTFMSPHPWNYMFHPDNYAMPSSSLMSKNFYARVLKPLIHFLPKSWSSMQDQNPGRAYENQNQNPMFRFLNQNKFVLEKFISQKSSRSGLQNAKERRKSNIAIVDPCFYKPFQLSSYRWRLNKHVQHYDSKMQNVMAIWCCASNRLRQYRMDRYYQLNGWVTIGTQLRYHNQIRGLGFGPDLNHTVQIHSYFPMGYGVTMLTPGPMDPWRSANIKPDQMRILGVGLKKLGPRLGLFYRQHLSLYKQIENTHTQTRCYDLHYYMRRQCLRWMGLPFIGSLDESRSLYVSQLYANGNGRYRPLLTLASFYILQIAQRDYASQKTLAKPNLAPFRRAKPWRLRLKNPDLNYIKTLHRTGCVYNLWPARVETKKSSILRPRNQLTLHKRVYMKSSGLVATGKPAQTFFDFYRDRMKYAMLCQPNATESVVHYRYPMIALQLKCHLRSFKGIWRYLIRRLWKPPSRRRLYRAWERRKGLESWKQFLKRKGKHFNVNFSRRRRLYRGWKRSKGLESWEQFSKRKRKHFNVNQKRNLKRQEEDVKRAESLRELVDNEKRAMKEARRSVIFTFGRGRKHYFYRKPPPEREKKERDESRRAASKAARRAYRWRKKNNVRLRWSKGIAWKIKAFLFQWSEIKLHPGGMEMKPNVRAWMFQKRYMDLYPTLLKAPQTAPWKAWMQKSTLQGECVAYNLVPSQTPWRTRYNDTWQDQRLNLQGLFNIQPQRRVDNMETITLQKRVERDRHKHGPKLNRQLDYAIKPSVYVYVVTKNNLTSYARVAPKTPLVGAFITTEQKISGDFGPQKSGQIFWIDRRNIMVRRADCFILPPLSRCKLRHGDCVDRNTGLMEVYFSKMMANDIIQGIAKIEGLFEARNTDLLYVTAAAIKMMRFYEPLMTSSTYCMKSNQVSLFTTIHEMQMCILETIQNVYIEQGVHIHDKHLELIVRQMTSKVRVTYPGNTGLLRSEAIDYRFIHTWVQPNMRYTPAVRGITQTALHAASFLSAASFQESVNVLTRCSFNHSRDFLKGLKASTILGHPLPMGTLVHGPTPWLFNKTVMSPVVNQLSYRIKPKVQNQNQVTSRAKFAFKPLSQDPRCRPKSYLTSLKERYKQKRQHYFFSRYKLRQSIGFSMADFSKKRKVHSVYVKRYQRRKQIVENINQAQQKYYDILEKHAEALVVSREALANRILA